MVSCAIVHSSGHGIGAMDIPCCRRGGLFNSSTILLACLPPKRTPRRTWGDFDIGRRHNHRIANLLNRIFGFAGASPLQLLQSFRKQPARAICLLQLAHTTTRMLLPHQLLLVHSGHHHPRATRMHGRRSHATMMMPLGIPGLGNILGRRPRGLGRARTVTTKVRLLIAHALGQNSSHLTELGLQTSQPILGRMVIYLGDARVRRRRRRRQQHGVAVDDISLHQNRGFVAPQLVGPAGRLVLVRQERVLRGRILRVL